jgi:hypothetical protein
MLVFSIQLFDLCPKFINPVFAKTNPLLPALVRNYKKAYIHHTERRTT